MAVYYELAIMQNKDSVEETRNEIWENVERQSSPSPDIIYALPGQDSWCSCEKQRPKLMVVHYEHKPALHTEVFETIKPIYSRTE